MIRSLLLTLLLTFLPFQKDDLWKRKTVIPVHPDQMAADNLGNLYAVKADEISKYGPKGELKYQYSHPNLGRITLLNVGEALKPIVFYQNLSRMVVLDNTLSIRGNPIDLTEHGLDQVSLICPSVRNHYWVFDNRDLALKRLNQDLEIQTTTGNLAQLLNIQPDPTGLKEFNEKVFLNVPSRGLLVFDIFGSHYKTIPIKDITSFQVTETTVQCIKDDAFLIYDRKTFQTDTLTLPDTSSPIEEMKMSGDHLFLQDPSGVRVYEKKARD